MKTIRIALVILVLVLLAAGGSLAAQDVQGDERLEAVEQLYRSEGPLPALPEFDRLLAEYEANADRYNTSLALGYIGECHWRLGNFDEARHYLDRSLGIKRELGDRFQQGKTLNVLGLLEWDLGNFDQAILRFEEANRIGREMQDRKLEGATLNNLSMVYDELGDYQRSLDQYGQVLEIYSGIDFPRGVGDTLGNIGGVHLLLGHYTESLDYYSRALEISRQLESVPAMCQDHGNLGLAYTGLGRIETALQHFETALEYARRAGMEQERGYWLRGRANAQARAGRYDLALENHKAVLELYESIDAKALLIEALHDMGRVYLTLGDLGSAGRNFEKALAISREIESSRGVTLSLLALGDLHSRHGQADKAIDLYSQALHRAEESGEANFQGEAQLRVAQSCLDKKQFEAAGAAAEKALQIARENDALPQQITALFMLAELDLEQRNLETALHGYAEAADRSSGLPDPELLWQIEYGRARAHEAGGDIEDAIEALQVSIGHIESVRNLLRESRFRTGYLQDKHQVYLMLARLQMAAGQDEQAFSTAERLRNWSFREQSASSVISPALTSEQELEEFAHRERIRQLQRLIDEEYGKAPPGRRQLALNTFSRELMLAEREYQAFLDDLNGHQGGNNPHRSLEPAALRARLRPSELLVEYLVGPENLMIFLLSREGLSTHSAPVSRVDLHGRVELLRDLLMQTDLDRWTRPAAGLSRTLVEPLAENGWLNDVEHLYIVPHEILNYLPFALLSVSPDDAWKPLIDEYFVTVLPTASVLAVDGGKGNGRSMLAAAPGKSRLKYASEEAESIVAMFSPNSRLISGAMATESTFKEAAGDYGMLHLATHGHFNRFNPMLSSLELEPDAQDDGMLEVHEILDLELASELVTLSACRTGLGSGYLADLPAGDEFVSLTRAFLQAGSASVLATLWEVDDRSTIELMKDFYRRLEEPGAINDKAVALAEAQRALRSSSRYGHPYFWAPYVLVGSVNPGSQGM